MKKEEKRELLLKVADSSRYKRARTQKDHGTTHIHTHYTHAHVCTRGADRFVFTSRCVGIYIYICAFVCVCTSKHLYIHTFIHSYINTLLHFNICALIHLHIYTSISLHLYMYTFIHVYVYIHTYIYTCRYIYTSTHINTHIHINTKHTNTNKTPNNTHTHMNTPLSRSRSANDNFKKSHEIHMFVFVLMCVSTLHESKSTPHSSQSINQSTAVSRHARHPKMVRNQSGTTRQCGKEIPHRKHAEPQTSTRQSTCSPVQHASSQRPEHCKHDRSFET